MSSELHDAVDDLLTRAQRGIESLQDDAVGPQEALETIEDLLAVADEVEDLLETVDVAALVEAVGAEDLSEVVDLEDVPEALEEGAPREAVHLRKLLKLADLGELFHSANVRQLRREKRELEEAIDDLVEDDGEAGAATADTVAGDGAGGGPASGSPGGAGDAIGGGADGAFGGDDTDTGERSVGPGVDQAVLQQAVQSKVDDAVVEFRQGLLAAHEELRRMRAANAERTGSVGRQSGSRNPTAFSSMPADEVTVGTGTKHSTVPRETRHSSAPNRERIYGDRFEEREETDG